MLALLTALTLSAIDADETPSRVRLGAELTSGVAVQSVGPYPMLLGRIELGVLPARWLRLQAQGSALWPGGSGAGWAALGGIDLVLPKWAGWGELFAGLSGGVLHLSLPTTPSHFYPVASVRGGIDLLVARPLYVGISLAYAFAVPVLHLVTLDLRIGVAF